MSLVHFVWGWNILFPSHSHLASDNELVRTLFDGDADDAKAAKKGRGRRDAANARKSLRMSMKKAAKQQAKAKKSTVGADFKVLHFAIWWMNTIRTLWSSWWTKWARLHLILFVASSLITLKSLRFLKTKWWLSNFVILVFKHVLRWLTRNRYAWNHTYSKRRVRFPSNFRRLPKTI